MISLHIFHDGIPYDRKIKLTKFSKLRALTLNDFEYKNGYNDLMIEGFEQLENLNYLCIDRFNTSDSRVLRQFTKLEYFSIQDVERPLGISSLLTSNKNLKYLNLAGRYWLYVC